MDNPDLRPEIMIDARGLSCPMPMLKVKKALKNMLAGQLLEIWGTDPGSKNDIPDFCRKNGSELLSLSDTALGHTRYLILKG